MKTVCVRLYQILINPTNQWKNIWTKIQVRLSLQPFQERPVRLRARTPPFHGGDTGSNPVRATEKRL